MKPFYVLILLFLGSNVLSGQNACNLTVSGNLICANDKEPLFPAVVALDGGENGVQTDEKGKFSFKNICIGNHRLRASFIGYQNLDTLIYISSDVKLQFLMKSSNLHLNTVHITTNKIEKQEVQTIAKSELSGEQLQQTRGQSLADATKEIAGVDVIHTGATISKPVIHGLYSNRILILNNGVRQEGQQWGAEHAPEIDPFIATKLSVIKGAASIRYGSDAIGGVILVEPADLPKEKCMNGEINLVGMDNSRLYTTSGILQGAFDNKLSGLSYRIQGTFRQAGNVETPHYILDNTGLLEENYSAALGYQKEHYGATVYYSHFYTQLGIFTYSEAGNPTDLVELFNKPEPINFPMSYYLKNGYYKINRAYQSVSHDLLKASAYVKDGSFGKLEVTFARQTDNRQEFGLDVPYSINGSLDNAPENNYDLTTHTTELIWEHNTFHHISGSIGASFMTQGNAFSGLTYTPIIPNYRNYEGGVFIIEKWNPSEKFTLEGGIRFDYKWQREYMLDQNSSQNFQPEYTSTQQYNATTISLGAIYRFTPKLSWDINAGNGWRAPSAYELYANGVHASVSQWEVGDSTLRVEKSYNLTSSVRYQGEKLEAEVGVYANLIENYIYNRPTLTTHQNIDGYFPVFAFTQTNALFKGVDFDLKWHITNHLLFEPKMTLVYANDLTTHGYLVLIPPQRFQAKLEYRWEKLWRFKNVFINIGNMSVPQQTRVPPNSDFVSPPKGYTLFSAAIGCSVNVRKQAINLSLQCTNILNTAYRDYMDYFRYYADEPGRTIQLRIRIPFQLISSKVPTEGTN